MSGNALASLECPNCGYYSSEEGPDLQRKVRPWHVMHGRLAVKSYVASLGFEAKEWLMALYVDSALRLLSVETIAQGTVSDCPVPKWRLISRAKALQAAGFILVHNHPSGDPRPSYADIQVTRTVALVSRELDVPLLDHLIIAGDDMMSCGHF